MSRYINREAVIEMLWDLVELENAYDMKKQAVEIVQNWEPSDVVEVVRCKDCCHWKNKHLCESWSRLGTINTKAEQFCSYGERVTT